MNPEQPIPPNPTIATPVETVRDQDKVMLVLAYLWLLGLIPLLVVKDSSYVQWHAKNGLVLSVGGGIALAILLTIVSMALPFLGLVSCFLWPAHLVLIIVGIIKALKGERWRIPGVSDIADKL